MSSNTDRILRIYTGISSAIASLFGPYRTKLFFEKAYWRWQKWREGRLDNRHYQSFYTDLFGLTLDDYQGQSILDIGCGPRGSLEWCTVAARRVGLDPLADSYRQMNPHLQMELIKAGAEAMPFPAAAFDKVCCFNALDHVDDLAQSLAEIYRVLKPGGDFLLITDIHDKPAVCEPTVIAWDLAEQLSDQYRCIMEKRLRRHQRIYASILRDEAHDPQSGEAYGLLVLQLRKV